MRQKVKAKDKTAIALVLCFCVIVLASAFTLKANIDRISDAETEEVDIKKPVAEEKAVEKEEAAAPVPVVESRNTESKSPPSQFQCPVVGEIICDYSGDGLVYSKTLEQYMEHKGIDIKGALDDQVKAAAGGIVTDVRKDPVMGTTIVIDHGNDLLSVYSNLSTDKLVEVGDRVEKGQVISGIGDTALFECADEAHLHFEVISKGKNVDPGKYTGL